MQLAPLHPGPCVAIAPRAAAGQLVTVHATGAVQMWWATDDGNGGGGKDWAAETPETTSPSTPRSAGGGWLGSRAERLAGPQPARGKVVGAAVVDRLLCIGHATGSLKIWVLPGGWGGSSDGGGAASSGYSSRGGGGGAAFNGGGDVSANGGAAGAGTSAGAAMPVPARIKAHRSGMVLLRAVDGGGHIGLATAGRFGSIMLWPLAELEAAVAAAQPPGARERKYPASGPSSSVRRGVIGGGAAAAAEGAGGHIPFGSDGIGSQSSAATPRSKTGGGGGASSQGSSLGANTALIPFKEIRLKKCIGEGSFGRVYMAVWSNHTEVAVKMLGPPASFAGKDDPLTKQRKAEGARQALAVGATAATEAAGAATGAATGAGAGDHTWLSLIECVFRLQKNVVKSANPTPAAPPRRRAP